MNADLKALSGSMVALVTPMRDSGEFDFACLDRLIDWHCQQGSDCLVVTGTTGESPTLDHDEHIEVIARCLRAARSRVPVIAGVGSNSTREAVDLSRRAHDLGVDACLHVAPYYNRPPQLGLYTHFESIARSVPAAHILYNVPARTGVDILPETVARLAAIDNIIGIKEASGSVARIDDLQAVLRPVRPDFRLYAGDDGTAVDVLAKGGVGSISVTANLVPDLLHRLCQFALGGEHGRARELDSRLRDLHEALFVQANPIPVKWALHQMGLIPLGIRLPLIPLEPACHSRVAGAMERAGISPAHSRIPVESS